MKQQLIRFFLPLLFLFSKSLPAAWVVTYSMTPSSTTFTSITGTSGATAVANFGFCPDQTVSPVIPIGFSFVFDGTTYTNFVATDNGILIFGNLASLSNCGGNAGTTTDIPNNLADASIPRPFLAPLWEELQFKPTSTGGFGSGSYKTVGSVGSRTLTMEWNKMCWRAPTNTDQITFQIILYEGTNIIDFNYFQGPTALGTSPTASIGLGAISPGTYYSLNNSSASPTVSSSTPTSSISTKPATNQRYRWTPAGSLPIELLSFRGFSEKNVNVLEWKTATQENNDYFTIEHSADCMEFSEIARVDGAGNSIALLDYTLSDKNPYSGITYYRLSWTDYNNVREYAGIISIVRKEEDPPLLYPNPAKDFLSFKGLPRSAYYSILNMAGQCVATGKIDPEQTQINVSGLPEGIYTLEIDSELRYKIIIGR